MFNACTYSKMRTIIHGQDLPEHTLTKEDELRLGTIIQNSKEDSEEYKQAFDLMVEGNLRLVALIAMEHASKCLTDCSELMDEGFFGLIKAIQKFDPENNPNITFASFARFYIKRSIRQYSFENTTIKVPMGISCKINPYKRMLGSGNSEETIKAKLNIKNSEMELIKNSIFSLVNMDRQIDNGKGKDTSFHDVLPDKSDMVEDIVKNNRKKTILDVVDSLDEKEKDLITLYYLGEEPGTLDPIAKKYKKSRERIRQQINIIMCKLRWKLKAMKFDE